MAEEICAVARQKSRAQVEEDNCVNSFVCLCTWDTSVHPALCSAVGEELGSYMCSMSYL